MIEFEKIIPEWWNPAGSQFAKWPEQAPLTDPLPGKYYLQVPYKGGQTAAQLFARGVSQINTTRIPDGEAVPNSKRSSGEPKSQDLLQGLTRTLKEGQNPAFGTSYNYVESEVKAVGRGWGAYPVVMLETGESEAWDPDDTTLTWLLQGIKEGQETNFGVGNGLRAFNYFTVWGGWDEDFWKKGFYQGTPMQYEFLYRYPVNQWAAQRPSITIPPKLASGLCNLSMEAHYRHWNYNEEYYLPAERFRMQMAKKCGFKAGLIVRPDNENIGFSAITRVTSPTPGIFARKGPSPLDPAELVACVFFSFWDADLFSLWITTSKSQGDTNKISEPWDNTPDVFIPDAGGKAVGRPPAGFNYTPGEDAYNASANIHMDFSHFGWSLYRSTVATEGGEKGFGRYRVDNGEWIEPNQYGAEMLHVEEYKRGAYEYRIKDGKITITYWNNYADNQEHIITLQDPTNPARTWQGKVFSKYPWVKTFNL